LREPTSKPVKTNSVDGLKLSWRDHKYHRFYTVVDQLVDELQGHVWSETGKTKRRLKGDCLEKLHYSAECYKADDEKRWLIALIADTGMRLAEGT
jgi:hypothetical protein